MVRKVPERPAGGNHDPALLSALQQYGYAINQLLDTFETGTWTPTFDFATPGDLSVSYSVQVGQFWRVGAILHFSLNVGFTPTFSSASGAAILSLPRAASAEAAQVMIPFPAYIASSIPWGSGKTSILAYVPDDGDSLVLTTHGSSTSPANLDAAAFTSGVAVTGIRVQGSYPIDADHP